MECIINLQINVIFTLTISRILRAAVLSSPANCHVSVTSKNSKLLRKLCELNISPLCCFTLSVIPPALLYILLKSITRPE